jgi:hypothetical protein
MADQLKAGAAPPQPVDRGRTFLDDAWRYVEGQLRELAKQEASSKRLTLMKGLAFVGRELDQWERERAGWQNAGSKRQPPSLETPAGEPLKPQQGPSAELRALLAEHDENGDRAPAPPVDAGWDAPS